jgi:hypothetical protein
VASGKSQVTGFTQHATRNPVLSEAEGTQHAIRNAHHVSGITHQASSLVFWLCAALIVGLFYLAISAWMFGFSGFPLDDAWIHQTYARNLARSGQLAFVPGVPSAGSTAPLWTVLLSLGYLLGLPFRFWTYGLGLVLLGLTGWTVARLGRRLFPESRNLGLWAGLFCVFEWHLIWAAVSGMETILFIWLSLLLFERYLASTSIEPSQQRWRSDFGLGILGGLLILTRPEGVGLVGLVGLDMAFRWWRQTEARVVAQLLKRWSGLVAGAGFLLLPYVAFHLQLTGLPFPNTFYAKQTEYGIILETFPLWWRLFGNIGPPVESVQGVFRVIFIGAQLLLLPGLLFASWLTIKENRWSLLPVWLWWVSYLLLYGLRLPVTYQHGRYQIPAIAWVILLGVWGTARLVKRRHKPVGRQLLGRVVGRALVISLLALVLAFTVVGAQAYGRDVRFIESEMVATAKWLKAQTAPDALIAAHDIGAIGYFAQRPLIDLAGLVTPEVIPFIRDEAALFDFIIASQADYLVTFPSWYPEMTRNSALIVRYSTQAPWAPQAGGDNMTVYQISPPTKP